MNKLLIFAVVVVVLVYYNQGGGVAGAIEYNDKYAADVLLYRTESCGYCKRTKKLLQQSRVDYLELDIERSQPAWDEFKALGGRGVPLLVIKGEVIKGFDAQRIKEAIGSI